MHLASPAGPSGRRSPHRWIAALAFGLAANLPAHAASSFDFSTVTGSGNTAEYSYTSNGGRLTVHNGADITITGTPVSQLWGMPLSTIVVDTGATATIHLRDVTITGPYNGQSALSLGRSSNVQLILEGSSTLKGGQCNYDGDSQRMQTCPAGIQVPGNGDLAGALDPAVVGVPASLTISGAGSLMAVGGYSTDTELGNDTGGMREGGQTGGAGIGGNAGGTAGNITITSGTVTAIGSFGGAGIGGGGPGNIVVPNYPNCKGGTTYYDYGSGKCTSIDLSQFNTGGLSLSGDDAFSLAGGLLGDLCDDMGLCAGLGGTIGGFLGSYISTLFGGYHDHDLTVVGGGNGGNGGVITITGGTVFASSTDGGAGIGGGGSIQGGFFSGGPNAPRNFGGASGAITITGGQVSAYGNTGGAGIGAGGTNGNALRGGNARVESIHIGGNAQVQAYGGSGGGIVAGGAGIGSGGSNMNFGMGGADVSGILIDLSTGATLSNSSSGGTGGGGFGAGARVGQGGFANGAGGVGFDNVSAPTPAIAYTRDGGLAAFSVNATGMGGNGGVVTLKYNWASVEILAWPVTDYRNRLPDSSILSGSTTNTLNLSNVPWAWSGNGSIHSPYDFSAVVTLLGMTWITPPAMLYVITDEDTRLISVHGQNVTVTGGAGSTANPYRINTTVPENVDAITLADLVVAAGSTVTMYSDARFIYTTTSKGLALGGDNLLYVMVTALDGLTNRLYQITVHRTSSDASLIQAGEVLVVNGGVGTAAAPFTASVKVPSNATYMNLYWLEVAYGATAEIFLDAGFTTSITTLDLPEASTTPLYVKVTADDGTTVNYYNVSVRRPSADAGLGQVAGQTPVIAPGGAGTLDDPVQASVRVGWSVTSITVADVLPAGALASAELFTDAAFATAGDVTLTPGKEVHAYIKITAEDGTEVYYDLRVLLLSASSDATAVPALNPAMLALLALLLTGVAGVFVRRRS